jgi:uncharacterized membrane protein YkvA (DUF1232 family)
MPQADGEREPSTLSRWADERRADRAAGRPERGLFTGRGRDGIRRVLDDGRGRRERSREERAREERAREERVREERVRDEGEEDYRDFDDRDARRARPRRGAKRSVLRAIRQMPAYVRLLLGLISDARVSRVDRFLVLAAAAYIVSPLDFIPDIIPFLGEVDDIFLLMLALQRLVENAGRTVLLDYWKGDPDELSDVNLAGMVSAAGFFLPSRLRRRLSKLARGTRRTRRA